MMKILRTIKLVILFPFGIFLYIFSPGFRSLVNAKMRGADDPINNGENVIAVLSHSNDKEYVGGTR
jgi:hypothetical protein